MPTRPEGPPFWTTLCSTRRCCAEHSKWSEMQ
nr:MAG TPA: hypothetical protein [Caudoviricetes sp.]